MLAQYIARNRLRRRRFAPANLLTYLLTCSYTESLAKQKVAVTERALFQRVNRKLKQNDQKLLTARGFWDGPHFHESPDLGRHYIIDTYRNVIVDRHVDLEKYGRELGALAKWEVLAGE
jgi:hypothetical protein